LTINELRVQNKKYLDKLNLPPLKGKQKIFLLEVDTPYKFDLVPINIIKEAGNNGIHGNSVSQIIKQVYDNAEFYIGNLLVDAVDFCIKNHIKIINASMGTGRTEVKETALKKYRDWGGIFITATGNSSGSPISYPGNSQYAIGVSATNTPDSDGIEIDITADSRWWVYNAVNNLIYPFDGTSASAPVITGCVAHILDYNPHWKFDDVRKFIIDNSVPLTEKYERFFSFPNGFGDDSMAEKIIKFQIGSDIYTVDGTAHKMDVKVVDLRVDGSVNGRLFAPIRFVANSLGIPDSDISYDSTTKTATIIQRV
jgi:hypothetical protein